MKFGINHNNFGVRPEISGIRMIVQQAFGEAGVPGECVATSCRRGESGGRYSFSDLKKAKNIGDIIQFLLMFFNSYFWGILSKDKPVSFHDVGLAEDYDSTEEVSKEIGVKWSLILAHKLGRQYDVLWHKVEGGRWHLHVEFDPK